MDEAQGLWNLCLHLPPGEASEGTQLSHPLSSRTDPSAAHTRAGRPGAANLHSQAEGLPLGGRAPQSCEPLCQALALDGTLLGTKGPLWGPVYPRKIPSAPISSLEFSKALSGHSGQHGTPCVWPWGWAAPQSHSQSFQLTRPLQRCGTKWLLMRGRHPPGEERSRSCRNRFLRRRHPSPS